jgi:hypothetical protein
VSSGNPRELPGPARSICSNPTQLAAKRNIAGNGTLGPFTFRTVRASEASPQPSGTCSGPNQLYFPSVAGAGVFRFQDGSLLKVNLTRGGDCIDFVALAAHCTFTFQITGGTDRFKYASGVLTLTETDLPVLADALHNPVFFADTGVYGNGLRSRQRGGPPRGRPRGAAIGSHTPWSFTRSEHSVHDERREQPEMEVLARQNRTPILSEAPWRGWGVRIWGLWSRPSILVSTQITSRQPLSNFVWEFSRGDRRGIELHCRYSSVAHPVWYGKISVDFAR